NLVHLRDALANDGEGFLPHVAVRHNVIWAHVIEFVDLGPRHQLIDLDRLLAFQRDCLELLVADLDVVAFLNLVGLNDILLLDFLARVLVDLAVTDAVYGLRVDLVEADFLALAGRGEKLDRARNQRETKKTLPIRTRGHDKPPPT